MIDNIFGYHSFCFIYLDDILIYSPDFVSHQHHLQQVLQLCRDHGLTINLDKCVFAVNQVEFMGLHVSASDFAPLQKHCSTTSQFPNPCSRSSFSPMIPRNDQLLQKVYPSGCKDSLTSDLSVERFSEKFLLGLCHGTVLLCSALLQVSRLVHPVASAPNSLVVDASESHIGAVLQQRVFSSWAPQRSTVRSSLPRRHTTLHLTVSC